MIVVVYKQTYRRVQAIRWVSSKALFTKIKCQDCEGTGLFILPDDSKWPCVCCKGIGRLEVSL